MTSFLGLAYELIGYPVNEYEAIVLLLLAAVIAFMFLLSIIDIFHLIASSFKRMGGGE